MYRLVIRAKKLVLGVFLVVARDTVIVCKDIWVKLMKI